jgi:hypothetical protein
MSTNRRLSLNESGGCCGGLDDALEVEAESGRLAASLMDRRVATKVAGAVKA